MISCLGGDLLLQTSNVMACSPSVRKGTGEKSWPTPDSHLLSHVTTQLAQHWDLCKQNLPESSPPWRPDVTPTPPLQTRKLKFQESKLFAQCLKYPIQSRITLSLHESNILALSKLINEKLLQNCTYCSTPQELWLWSQSELHTDSHSATQKKVTPAIRNSPSSVSAQLYLLNYSSCFVSVYCSL